mgnify:CR=1 FL=1
MRRRRQILPLVLLLVVAAQGAAEDVSLSTHHSYK